MPKPDLRGLCLVTDQSLCGSRGLDWVIAESIRGGVTSVQLREKHLPIREMVAQALHVKQLLSGTGVPLIINDRVDVALAVAADGVHVGQDDLPCEMVRRLMGPTAIVGLSVETWDDVVRAQTQPVDYLGVSPVFATPTKTDTKSAWGLEGLARIRAFSRHPLVAIGGLNQSTIRPVVQAGASGIAVVSALCATEDPCAAARALIATGWPQAPEAPNP